MREALRSLKERGANIPTSQEESCYHASVRICHISIVIIVCVESAEKKLECQLPTESKSTCDHVIWADPVRAQKVTFSF